VSFWAKIGELLATVLVELLPFLAKKKDTTYHAAPKDLQTDIDNSIAATLDNLPKPDRDNNKTP
jgi:hypothetical protein